MTRWCVACLLGVRVRAGGVHRVQGFLWVRRAGSELPGVGQPVPGVLRLHLAQQRLQLLAQPTARPARSRGLPSGVAPRE